MDLHSQRGKEMYRDEYNFIYTLNGKNKEGTKLYWTCARKKTYKARVHTVSGQVVFRSSVHTHAPDTAEARVASQSYCHHLSSTNYRHPNVSRLIGCQYNGSIGYYRT